MRDKQVDSLRKWAMLMASLAVLAGSLSVVSIAIARANTATPISMFQDEKSYTRAMLADVNQRQNRHERVNEQQFKEIKDDVKRIAADSSETKGMIKTLLSLKR